MDEGSESDANLRRNNPNRIFCIPMPNKMKCWRYSLFVCNFTRKTEYAFLCLFGSTEIKMIWRNEKI